MNKIRNIIILLSISIIFNIYLLLRLMDYRSYIVDLGMRMQIHALEERADAFAKLKINPNAKIYGGYTILGCKEYEARFGYPEGLENEFEEWMDKGNLEAIRVNGWPVKADSNVFRDKKYIIYSVKYK